MRQSELFTKTRREDPSDETAKNAKLLIRGGYIHKEMAGVYSLLPLGLRVIKNIEAIIREEMNALGGQEVYLSALQDRELWKTTERWSDEVVDDWFKTTLKGGGETGLGFTHEEPLTRIMSEHISSYRDLPVFAYQFQTKFRNELRAKSGILRGREFLMKDLYSFSKDDAEHETFYERAKQAYRNVFDRAGIGGRTFLTFASGGSFSKYSHEFQTLCDAGEDVVYLDEEKGIAVNKEVFTNEVCTDLGLEKPMLVEKQAIEVGNIFSLGTKFSKPLGLKYRDENGEEKPVVMGSYGIGLGRLMGTIVETLSDEKGIVWPERVAPFRAHLLTFGAESDADVRDAAERAYEALQNAGIETLFDDRVDASPGEKLADADLLGMPMRLVVSKKTLAAAGGAAVEFKRRVGGESVLVPLEKVADAVKS